jgi:hypothetical protein
MPALQAEDFAEQAQELEVCGAESPLTAALRDFQVQLEPEPI